MPESKLVQNIMQNRKTLAQKVNRESLTFRLIFLAAFSNELRNINKKTNSMGMSSLKKSKTLFLCFFPLTERTLTQCRSLFSVRGPVFYIGQKQGHI